MKSALIIDDDVTTRIIIEDLLKKVSFEVEKAEDGWEGVKMAKNKKYDLIILDLRMPSLDGEQALTILNKMNKSYPVLIISSYLTKEKIIRLKKANAKGFLVKPIDERKFYNEVYRICPFDVPEE